ncbi:unnamed protein product [Staurois parvus]|uniref:Reverse transcriptase zinc-binding domain-containing protein n=1 Tax=Staurois parvus TaxID=386267 RepID=A0ABN9DZ09_9NEOB|nr:unnamed protein product [Staurois parvus]
MSVYTRIVIREWDKMHKQRKWDFNSLLMPLRNSEFFPPGKEEISGRWIMKEDAQLRDVMEGVNLRTLEDLKKEEGRIFTGIDIWRYNQLKQFVEKLTKPLRTRKEWNEFEKYLEDRGDGKHSTAKAYKALTDLDRKFKLKYIEKWEKDLGVEWEEHTQRKIYRMVHENISMREVEMNFKCLTRWYVTPVIEHKMREEKQPWCWRGCGGLGTMYHIWWECPKIHIYWAKVINQITIITGMEIGLDPEICLFHNSILSGNKYKELGILCYLNAAKNLIPKFWRKVEAPSEEDWMNRVDQIARLEKLYYIQEDRMVTYHMKWEKWEEYKVKVKKGTE